MNTASLHYAFIAIALFISETTFAQEKEQEYHDAIRALSPDLRFGVTVPNIHDDSTPNQLIELSSGRVLADIVGDFGTTKMNHGGCSGNWTKDGSLLVWTISGKWTDHSIVLLKMQEKPKPFDTGVERNVVWQTNIYSEAEQAISARTKEAAPNAQSFTVYVGCDISDPLAWPLKIYASLTTHVNMRGVPGAPKPVNSYLDGAIDVQGKFSVTEFKMGERPEKEKIAVAPLPLPPPAEIRALYEESDRRLNELYQSIMERETPEGQEELRRYERAWLTHREAMAQKFSAIGPQSESASRKLNYLTHANDSRIRELELYLSSLQ